MSDLRKAAQAVLDRWDGRWDWRDDGPTADLMKDLRVALAEPEQDGICKHCTEGCPACDARKQTTPKPVAWRITDGEGDWEYRTDLPEDWSIQWSASYGRKYEPLYTAPPQQPICDECGKSKTEGWALYCVDCMKPVFDQRGGKDEQ